MITLNLKPLIFSKMCYIKRILFIVPALILITHSAYSAYINITGYTKNAKAVVQLGNSHVSFKKSVGRIVLFTDREITPPILKTFKNFPIIDISSGIKDRHGFIRFAFDPEFSVTVTKQIGKTVLTFHKNQTAIPISAIAHIPDPKLKIDIVAPSLLKPDGKLFYSGVKFYYSKNYSGAQELFKKIVNLYPKSAYYPASLVYLAETNIKFNRLDYAKTVLQKAIKFPSNQSMMPDALFMLAESYGKNNIGYNKISLLNLISDRYAGTASASLANLKLGKEYLKSKSFQKARAKFKSASDRYKLASLIGYGASYAEDKETVKANLYFTKAYYYAKTKKIGIDKFEKLSEPYMPVMIKTFCVLHEFDLAHSLIDNLKRTPATIYSQAECLKEQGSYQNAAKLFYAAYKAKPAAQWAADAKRNGAVSELLSNIGLAKIEKIRNNYKYDDEIVRIATLKESELLIKNKRFTEALNILYKYANHHGSNSIWNAKAGELAGKSIDNLMTKYRADPKLIDLKKLIQFAGNLHNPDEIAHLLIKSGRISDAESLLNKMKGYKKYKNGSLTRLAYIAIERNDLTEAEKLINSVDRKSVSNMQVYWEVIGNIAFRQKRFGMAITYYKSALKIKKTAVDMTMLADSYYRKGNYDKVFETLRSKKPMPADYKVLGSTEFKLLKYKKAVYYLSKAENDDESNLYFAESLYKIGNLDKAEKILKRLKSHGGVIKVIAESQLFAIKSRKIVKASEKLK